MKYFSRLMALLCLLWTPSLFASPIVLTKDNSLRLMDSVYGDSVNNLTVELLEKHLNLPPGEPLYLVLSTPGGSIQAGVEFIDVVSSIIAAGRPVHTITQFAASMGFQIAHGLSERIILPAGVLMSHNAYGGFRGEFGQDGAQLDNRVDFWKSRIARLDDVVVAKTKGKQTKESYRKHYENEYWCEGQKCVDDGYADRVGVVTCDRSLNGTTKHVEEFTSFFWGVKVRIDYETANCPLVTSYMNVKVEVTDLPKKEEDKKDGTKFVGPIDPLVKEKVIQEFIKARPHLEVLFRSKEEIADSYSRR